MSAFRFSKIDRFRQSANSNNEEIIDIKFPSELGSRVIDTSQKKDVHHDDLLIFVVDDDPVFMQLVNTHFSKLVMESPKGLRKIVVKNYATGGSCINDLGLKPDIIFLNYFINNKLPNALRGSEIMDKIIDTNPNQKVVILNDLKTSIRHAFVEEGLRDYIIDDPSAVNELDNIIHELLDGRD